MKRIAAITLAFTIGHLVTLALGALGLPVPQQSVEALIAVSILVAAAHAVRPIFAGKEVLLAAGFGLVHGMAFSATLSELQLTGGQLVLSLLGFNLGIELMQLAVVALVLPPLILLSRTRAYTPLRIGAGAFAGIALGARLGIPHRVASLAASLRGDSLYAAVGFWLAGVIRVATIRRRRNTTTPRPKGVALTTLSAPMEGP